MRESGSVLLKESGSQGYRPRAMRRWKIKVGQIIEAFSVPCKDGKPIRRDTAFQFDHKLSRCLIDYLARLG
jgi:hypothetical protein